MWRIRTVRARCSVRLLEVLVLGGTAVEICPAELGERRRGRRQAFRELEEALQAIAERRQFGRRAVVRAAADDRFTRVEEQVEHRLARGGGIFCEGGQFFGRRGGRGEA